MTRFLVPRYAVIRTALGGTVGGRATGTTPRDAGRNALAWPSVHSMGDSADDGRRPFSRTPTYSSQAKLHWTEVLLTWRNLPR